MICGLECKGRAVNQEVVACARWIGALLFDFIYGRGISCITFFGSNPGRLHLFAQSYPQTVVYRGGPSLAPSPFSESAPEVDIATVDRGVSYLNLATTDIVLAAKGISSVRFETIYRGQKLIVNSLGEGDMVWLTYSM